MKLVACVVLILAAAWKTNAAGSVSSSQGQCDEGWSYQNKMCYKILDTYDTREDASISCGILGGTLAYAKDANALAFLQRMVKQKTSFGWWYGMQIVRYVHSQNVYYKLDDPDKLHPQSLDKKSLKDIPIPKPYQYIPPTTAKCVGMVTTQRREFSYTAYKYVSIQSLYMTVVPCPVKLPFICTGPPNKVKQDPSNVSNSTTDVYWFSNFDDRRTYDDAKQACSDRSMTLLSIRNDDEKSFVMNQTMARNLNHADPWWTGLQVNYGDDTWSNGVAMNTSLLSWAPNQLKDGRLLLSNGVLAEVDTKILAPSICMKEENLNLNFGCPAKWSRGGQSCYRFNKRWKKVKHEAAERYCANAGSHIVSIDSQEEKLWLRLIGRYYNAYWTSLNDKQKTGDFVWSDGSEGSPSIVTWESPSQLNRYDHCYSLHENTGELETGNCRYSTAKATCQYRPTNGGACASDRWFAYQGNCYFVTSGPTIKHDSILSACIKEMEKYNVPDAWLVAKTMVIHSKVLLDKIKHSNDSLWLDMKFDRGAFVWKGDNSLVDITLFQPKSTSDKHFAIVDMATGRFRKVDSQYTAILVCEKDIPYHPQMPVKTGSLTGSAPPTMLPLFGIKFLMTFFLPILSHQVL